LPEFRYSVIDAKGQPLTGVVEAENEESCRKIIAQRGLYCLSVGPVSLASRSINIGNAKINTKELSVFCRQFATMLNSGIGIIKSLDILYSQSDKPKFKAILKRVYESVQRGQSFSASLSAQGTNFPDFMINMVEVGEASGTLDKVMEKIAEHYEKSMKTGNKVKSAMTYPIILGSLTISVVIILMVFVLPVFIKMFEASGAALPLPTQILIAISNSMTGYWYVYIFTICIIYIVFTRYLSNETGRINWDKFKTTIPVAGKLNLTVLSARFARTLATMMESGIPLIKSLEITAKVMGNKYFESGINAIREEIKKGIPMSTAIKKAGLFPVMLVSMITIGEESGTLDEVLGKTASFYDEEADNAVSKLVGLLEPLMIVVMATIVGFIVISIIMPMYGMMKLVN
jgi:Type II secretory pathway, component PulF